MFNWLTEDYTYDDYFKSLKNIVLWDNLFLS